MKDYIATVTVDDWSTAKDLLQLIKLKKGVTASQDDLVDETLYLRLVKIIKDEYRECKKGSADLRQQNIFSLFSGREETYDEPISSLRGRLIEASESLNDEIAQSEETIADKAREHIKSGETILTYGFSKFVQAFLKKAAETDRFDVIFVDSPGNPKARQMAQELSSSLHVTVIPHTNVFAVMPRVSKVIVEPHLVFQNGGFKAVAGMHVIALAAKHYSKTFFACVPTLKFCPRYFSSSHGIGCNELGRIDNMLEASDGDLVGPVRLINPMFDYVPPELVTLFVTETGDHPPGYCYRLVTELYGTSDGIRSDSS